MPDTMDPATRSRTMSKIRAKNTTIELRVRRAVHRAGFRYRIHRRDLPGTPDMVFPRFRTAVFVDGCFWHWHGCGRSRMPGTNREFWEAKMARNMARDAAVRAALRELGWTVRTIWECDLAEGTERLIAELRERRETFTPALSRASGEGGRTHLD